MKTSYFKQLLLFVITATAIASANGQDVSEKKINKNFATKSDLTLEVWNKFGDLTLKTWDKNEIGIEVTVRVENFPSAKTREYLEGIDLAVTEQANLIKVETKFSEGVQKALNNQSKGKKIIIHYTIMHPVYQKFNLNNRYGDINIEEMSGKSTINLKYGDLTAGKLMFDDTKPFSTLDIAFGKAKISKTSWMQFHSSYSDITVDEGTALIIISKYSNINTGTVHSVVLDGKYDNYSFFSIKNLIAEAKYTTLNITSLSKQLHLTLEYGTLKAKGIQPGFEKIKVDAKYSQCNLNIAPDACYQIQATTDYGSINTPQKANINRKKSSLTETVSGWVGCNGGSESITELNGKYTDFDLLK